MKTHSIRKTKEHHILKFTSDYFLKLKTIEPESASLLITVIKKQYKNFTQKDLVFDFNQQWELFDQFKENLDWNNQFSKPENPILNHIINHFNHGFLNQPTLDLNEALLVLKQFDELLSLYSKRLSPKQAVDILNTKLSEDRKKELKDLAEIANNAYSKDFSSM